MQAIILAAGMGKRLQELTKNNTKCMVEVCGETLISRLLKFLDIANLSRVVIVIGYKGEKLKNYIETLRVNTPIVYIENSVYDKTNNIYSLALAEAFLLEEDTILFESDLIFDEEIVKDLISDSRKNLAVVDRYESWMDGTCLVIDDNDNITDFVSGKHLDYSHSNNYFKTVNIYKFSREFLQNTYVPFLEAYRKAMGQNEYYESVIKLISMLGTNELKAKRLSGQKWYEIDDAQDLDIAESIFSSGKKKYDLVSCRYGGYWRYPKLLDFCYLVNPFFPTNRMMDEMKASMDNLIRNYPSGMRVNTLLAARNHKVNERYLAVGNGAAEIINHLLQVNDYKRVGIVRPTFEEYPNRIENGEVITYLSDKEDFSYTEDDLINFFVDKGIESLIIINPDNPTGNFVKKSGIVALIEWANEKNIDIIIDESFVDFADEMETFTLLRNDYLEKYNNIYVVKSISKSYGIPGLRLGVIASSNIEKIARLKKKMSIWNINSIAEFYLQIYAKYEKDYVDSLRKVRKVREKFVSNLNSIEYIKVFPSQANYVCCELLNGFKAEELAVYLLEKNIFIKDLTAKISNGKQYVRLAVRDDVDNKVLVEALKEYE